MEHNNKIRQEFRDKTETMVMGYTHDGIPFSSEYVLWLEDELNKLRIGGVMPRFILMGVEFNDIWKLPDFYVCEDEGTLHTANDDIEEATDFDYDNAIEAKNWLQEKYNDYTWYMVALNGA